MALPWPNTTKLPLGVTMVLVSQVPKWHGHGSGLTKPPSDYVALSRSRGMTGSDMTKSPSDLVAFAYQEAWYWFGHDQSSK